VYVACTAFPVSQANHPQALIDGPNASVPRQSIPYRSLILTPYTLAALPRAAGSGAIKKAFEKAGVQAKWEASSWAKKLQAREERKAASDFARFEILLAKKSRRDLVSNAMSLAAAGHGFRCHQKSVNAWSAWPILLSCYKPC
jgi:ribosomal protein L14E/L6E/L27E